MRFKEWEEEYKTKRFKELVFELEELASKLKSKSTSLGKTLDLTDTPGTELDPVLTTSFYNSVKDLHDELNQIKEDKVNAKIQSFFRFENEFGRIPLIIRELDLVTPNQYKLLVHNVKSNWNSLIQDRRPFKNTWFTTRPFDR